MHYLCQARPDWEVSVERQNLDREIREKRAATTFWPISDLSQPPGNNAASLVAFHLECYQYHSDFVALDKHPTQYSLVRHCLTFVRSCLEPYMPS